MDAPANVASNTALIQSLSLRSFLSFGPEAEPIELRNLNVLIGPNGSGKSNIINSLSLLKACATGLEPEIFDGGGIFDWIWKGLHADLSENPSMVLECIVDFPEGIIPLWHRVTLAKFDLWAAIAKEQISNHRTSEGMTPEEEYFFRSDWTIGGRSKWGYSHDSNVAIAQIKPRERIDDRPGEAAGRLPRDLHRADINFMESVLSQRKDSDHYPEITYLGQVYSKFFLFRSIHLGSQSPLRGPQVVNLPSKYLLEDGSNLGLVLNDLLNNPKIRDTILHYLGRFYRFADSIHTKIERGTIDTYLQEFSYSLPSRRLSDGTLRFLCLMAILCHPEPSPLICIEDPEIGLHPDSLPVVADMIKEAAKKTQVIVTTQSDVLVSAFSDMPEAVLVCERDESGTSIRRLEQEKLDGWLEDYSLGTLWRKGEIGGNP